MNTATESTPDAARPEASASPTSWAPLLVLLAIAAVLRLHRLGSQLWLDEMSALGGSMRRPLAAIATEWPGASSHVLYELLARLSLVAFGEGPVSIRLPAMLFGVLGVGAFYVLATRLCERRHAIALGSIFALSYHHIFFSQNARGYTTLIFFFLLASAMLLEFRRAGRMSVGGAAAYGLTLALAAYANLFGAFIAMGHVLVVAAAALWPRWTAGGVRLPLRRFALAVTGAAAATVVLYLPFLGSLIRYAEANVANPAEGPRLGWGLVQEVVEGLSAALFGPVGVMLAVGVGLLGLARLFRRHPFGVALLIAPLLLQLFAMVAAGIGIHPRYLAVALPVAILIGGYGAVSAIELAVRAVTKTPALRRRLAAGGLAVMVAASAVPLVGYYAYPKQDYLGAMALVDSLATPADTRVGVHLAGHVIEGFYGADYQVADRLEELLAIEAGARRVWAVTTLERLMYVEDAALFDHLRANYRLVRVLPGTVGDGAMRIYERTF